MKFRVSKANFEKIVDVRIDYPDFIELEGEVVEDEFELRRKENEIVGKMQLPPLPEEIGKYQFGGPAENVLYEEMPKLYGKIDELIRYLRARDGQK